MCLPAGSEVDALRPHALGSGALFRTSPTKWPLSAVSTEGQWTALDRQLPVAAPPPTDGDQPAAVFERWLSAFLSCEVAVSPRPRQMLPQFRWRRVAAHQRGHISSTDLWLERLRRRLGLVDLDRWLYSTAVDARECCRSPSSPRWPDSRSFEPAGGFDPLRLRLTWPHFTESLTHFVVKLVRAAPVSFLSSASPSQVACTSGVPSVTHFLRKLAFAAPTSRLS